MARSMQATVPRLAISSKGHLAEGWARDQHRPTLATAARGSSPTSARSPSCAPAGSGAGCPSSTLGLVLYGVSIALMVRGDLGLRAVGRAALRPHPAPADHARPGAGDRELRGAGALDPAARDARHRHHLQRDRLSASRPTRSSRPARPARGAVAPRRLMVGGVAVCGLATAMYIGAQLGRGPRDGLMTGFAGVPASRCAWSAPASRSRSSSSACCSAASPASARSSTPWPSAR